MTFEFFTIHEHFSTNFQIMTTIEILFFDIYINFQGFYIYYFLKYLHWEKFVESTMVAARCYVHILLIEYYRLYVIQWICIGVVILLSNSKNNYVPEVLYVYINKMYKKITTIKWNKLKFEKVLKKKSHFLSQKLIFHWFKRKIVLKKVDFFIFVHMNIQNFRHIK